MAESGIGFRRCVQVVSPGTDIGNGERSAEWQLLVNGKVVLRHAWLMHVVVHVSESEGAFVAAATLAPPYRIPASPAAPRTNLCGRERDIKRVRGSRLIVVGDVKVGGRRLAASLFNHRSAIASHVVVQRQLRRRIDMVPLPVGS